MNQRKAGTNIPASLAVFNRMNSGSFYGGEKKENQEILEEEPLKISTKIGIDSAFLYPGEELLNPGTDMRELKLCFLPQKGQIRLQWVNIILSLVISG